MQDFFTEFMTEKNKVCFLECLLIFNKAEETDASEIWPLIDWFDVSDTSNWSIEAWNRDWLTDKDKLIREEKLTDKDKLTEI